jgi:hypothetical protein
MVEADLNQAMKHREQTPSATDEGQGWLEVEGSEDSTLKQGDLFGGTDGPIGETPQVRTSRSQSVRSSDEAG